MGTPRSKHLHFASALYHVEVTRQVGLQLTHGDGLHETIVVCSWCLIKSWEPVGSGQARRLSKCAADS